MNKKSIGISLISAFFIFGALVLLVTVFMALISNNGFTDKFGISYRIGILILPEYVSRIALAILSIVMAIGLLKYKRWGFWLFEVYSLYMIIVNITLCIINFDSLFFGNLISGLLFLTFVFSRRKLYLR